MVHSVPLCLIWICIVAVLVWQSASNKTKWHAELTGISFLHIRRRSQRTKHNFIFLWLLHADIGCVVVRSPFYVYRNIWQNAFIGLNIFTHLTCIHTGIYIILAHSTYVIQTDSEPFWNQSKWRERKNALKWEWRKGYKRNEMK